jgi:methyltransferase (TIGR00027 family)
VIGYYRLDPKSKAWLKLNMSQEGVGMMSSHLHATDATAHTAPVKNLFDGVAADFDARHGKKSPLCVGNEVDKVEGVSWEDDYRERMNPPLVTRLLSKAVPVLEQVEWRVEEVSDGGCHSILPLTVASTNQHGTHQAALISLSADYTGGIALATLIRGTPVIGVHSGCGENAALMWLASMKVRYRRPSTAELHGRCRVPADMVKTVRQRYANGKRVLISLLVEFTDPDGNTVAEAEMRYFLHAQQDDGCSQKSPQDSVKTSHKLKASARLIAGLRANMDVGSIGSGHRYDQQAAGPHGAVLAERLSQVLPQLQQVVSARTRHIDEFLGQGSNFQQVVLLGAGLDMRPFRVAQRDKAMKTFEIDLPVMLQERELVISALSDLRPVKRHMLAADFKRDRVGKLLEQCSEFDPDAPTIVIYEGCSMYFTKDENTKLLSDVRTALRNERSVIWADMVTQAVVEGTTNQPEIAEFLAGMHDLGERFVFGCDQPEHYMRECGFAEGEVVSAQQYLGSNDPSLGTYQFVISRLAA